MVINANGTQLTEFLENEQAIAVMEHMTAIVNQKKALEEQEREMRKALEDIMEQYGVKSFENDLLRVTYKSPSTRESVDSSKLRNEYPDVFNAVKREVPVKASVVIKVKGE